MVYLDFNASTPIDPRVREAMAEIGEEYANPSSEQHPSGQRAAHILEDSRETVAAHLNSSVQDVIFTSGATEAATIAILGLALGLPAGHRNIVTVTTEHKAITSAAQIASRLAQAELRMIPVDENGLIDEAILVSQVDSTVGLVVVMLANNETGVIQPLAKVAELARSVGAIVVSDVTQAVGKMSFDLSDLGIDVAFMSGHKIYGPKGTGALVVPRRLQKRMVALFAGGGQERGFRGGTQNVVALRGLAAAFDLSVQHLPDFIRNSVALTSSLRLFLERSNVRFEVIAESAPRISNTLGIRFLGLDAEAMMANMPALEVSTGSACNSANPEPSHVLLAMGMDRVAASQCIRFSFGRDSSEADVDFAGRQVVGALDHIRPLTEQVRL